ncbi:LON peptidase substrate-binding domain-containing protein [Xanthocytophaga agilis]|nr:LON peptidase substrate-binding domain-containing protein [Xanthocytophaga agilis]
MMKTKFLPLFPLTLVAYPHERINLHIFEPRYQQLITECLENGTTFGIPAFINNQIQQYGTEMRVTNLRQRYDDGKMDIETEGLEVFKIQRFENPTKGKLYAAGDVEILTIWGDPQSELVAELMTKVKILYKLLQSELKLRITDYDYFSYQIAHKVGLSVESEYELLKITSEKDRQRYLLKHLEKTIPVMENMEATKERIRMNGHFKHFDPLNF